MVRGRCQASFLFGYQQLAAAGRPLVECSVVVVVVVVVCNRCDVSFPVWDDDRTAMGCGVGSGGAFFEASAKGKLQGVRVGAIICISTKDIPNRVAAGIKRKIVTPQKWFSNGLALRDMVMLVLVAWEVIPRPEGNFAHIAASNSMQFFMRHDLLVLIDPDSHASFP